MADHSSKKKLIEPLIVWAVVIALARLVQGLRGFPVIGEYSLLITAILLLYTPVLIYWRKGQRLDFLDDSLSDYTASLKLVFIFSLIIFGVSVAVVALVPFLQFVSRSAGDLGAVLLTQILLVALPEEFFFRGYLQGRFNDVFGRPWKLLGAPVGPGLLWVSLLFAVSHSLILFQPWHILIFFPSLAFGWLREKGGTITASVLFHAFCNLLAYLTYSSLF